VLEFQLVHHIAYDASKQFPPDEGEEVGVGFPGLGH